MMEKAEIKSWWSLPFLMILCWNAEVHSEEPDVHRINTDVHNFYPEVHNLNPDVHKVIPPAEVSAGV